MSKPESKPESTFDLTVNGRAVSVTVANEETPLLAVLRDALGLVGTRFGCGLEQCGCCMVLIDGAPAKSCAKPIWTIYKGVLPFCAADLIKLILMVLFPAITLWLPSTMMH